MDSCSGNHYELHERFSSPDMAYNFLSKMNISAEASAKVDLSKLRRKIDWCIVPVMFLCYTMQFIDKVSLNVSKMDLTDSRADCHKYAAVMGLPKDLKLKGNDFSNAATSFFIAYLIAEIPNGK